MAAARTRAVDGRPRLVRRLHGQLVTLDRLLWSSQQ